MTAKKITELAESIVGSSYDKPILKESVFREAVPAAIELERAAKGALQWARMVSSMAKAVSDAASLYAIDHPEKMDEPLSDERTGVQTGYVTIDGKTYHLAVSKGEPKRINGANMTQEFLEKLPTGWQKSVVKTLPDKDYLMTLSASELAKKGIFFDPKYAWRVED